VSYLTEKQYPEPWSMRDELEYATRPWVRRGGRGDR
jgi:hypothetical protein